MGSPYDRDVKWILRAGFNVDPPTLAKNLSILCTAAFSATVLHVMYSNSGKRPQYADNNVQVCFLNAEETSDEDHTTQCETRCPHSVVGSSDESKPPDSLMRFGSLLEDVQSPSSRRACRLDSTVDVNSTNDSLGESEIPVASGPNATNDVGILDGRQDDNCLKTSENINNAETQNMPSDRKSFCDVNIAAKGAVDGHLTSTESSCAKISPSTTDTASGPYIIENSGIDTPPLTTTIASDPDVIASSSTQTPSSTTSTASGPDGTADVNRATGNMDDTSKPAQILPLSSGGALGSFSNSNPMSAGVSTSDQPVGLFKKRSEAHRDIRSMRENAHFHSDPDCTRAPVDRLRHCKEGETHLSRRELDVSDEDRAENLYSMEEEADGGSHFEGYIYGIIQDKGSKSYKRRVYGEVAFAKERKGHGDADCCREEMGLGEKIGIRYQETCTQIGCGKMSPVEGDSTRRSQKIVEGIRKMNSDTALCKDKGTSTSIDIYSDPHAKGARTERPLKKLNVGSKEKTHHLLEKKSEKCRDKGTSTSVDACPASSTKGSSWRGRPLKQTRTMPKEENCHIIDNNLDVIERCVEERREGGIPSMHSQPVDPLEQTKCSLRALTETQHWSKMSLSEQYEYLGLLDSTIAAASAEWKGNCNVTYWRHKDSAPLPKPSGLNSLCKPQPGESEYSSRDTPGRREDPAPKTGSPVCPTPDMIHSCFPGDADCTNIPSSSGQQVEQYNVGMNGQQRQHCAEVTCVEAREIMQEKQGNQAQTGHPRGNHQPSSLISTACHSLSQRLPRSTPNINLHDEPNRRAYVCLQTQNLHYEAARETLARARVRAKNSNYHCM